MLDIAVARDNARFASVGGDRLVFLWDVETGGTIRRWSGHGSRVEAVEFGGEDDAVVISGTFPPTYLPTYLPTSLPTLTTLEDVIFGGRDTLTLFRKCRHSSKSMGYPLQLTKAHPILNRCNGHGFIPACAYALVRDCGWELRWPRARV